MPKGIFIRTEEHKKNISKSMQGKGGHPLETHPNWNGGRKMMAGGYVQIKSPGHPYANADNYVYEHRLVMEKELERYLTPEETVHHKDKNCANNDPSNLQLFKTKGDHMRYEFFLKRGT